MHVICVLELRRPIESLIIFIYFPPKNKAGGFEQVSCYLDEKAQIGQLRLVETDDCSYNGPSAAQLLQQKRLEGFFIEAGFG